LLSIVDNAVSTPCREGQRRRACTRARWVPPAATTGLLTLLTLALSMVAPAAAQAKIPVVGGIPVVGEAVEGISTIGEAVINPNEAVVKMFLKLLQAIFGGFEAHLIAEVVAGLLAVPNFATGHVAGLEQTTVAIAGGMLTAVLTLSILRYYIVGLVDSGSGGFEALQGLVRVVAAVGFIILWPSVFSELLEITSAFNHALLGSASVQHNVALLFDAALTFGAGAFTLDAGIGLIFVILIGLVGAVVFLALMWMKVMLSVMMMFLYVSMPLAVVLWPVPELGWLAVSAMKALSVAVIAPSIWAILFSLSAAVNADVITLAPSHSIIDTVIVRPLAGITLMLLCITIPRFLMKTAMIGPQGQGGGWRVWRTVTFGMFAGRAMAGVGQTVAAAAVEGHPTAKRFIDSLPTPVQPPSQPGGGGLAGRVAFGRSGFTSKPGPGGSEGQSEAAGSSADADGARSAIARQQGAVSVPGIERPEFDRGVVESAWQSTQATAGIAPPSAGDVKAAMGKFAPETQRGIAEFNTANQGRMRHFATQHAASGSLTGEQRDALLTLGAAPKSALNAGINHAVADLDQSPQGSAATSPASTPQANTATGGGHPASSTTPAAQPAAPPVAGAAAPEGSSDSSALQGSSSVHGGVHEQPSPGTASPTGAADSGVVDPEPFLD
jgi:hypothetical protein